MMSASQQSSIPTGRRRARAAGRGFTLIELMIATVLSLVISAMMFSVLTSQEKAAGQNESNARMQEQLRFALQVMARQVRMAGYGIGFEINGSERYAGVPTLAGCDRCGKYGGDPDSSVGETTGSDQLVVIYRNPAAEFDLDHQYLQRVGEPLCNTSSLPSEGGPQGENIALERGETIVCMDESTLDDNALSYAWTVTAAVTTGGAIHPGATVNVTANDSPEYNSRCVNHIDLKLRCGSLTGSTIGFYLDKGTLWMDDDGDSLNTSTLQLDQANPGNTNDVPIARGIEDMQFAFCIPDPGATLDERNLQLEQCMQDQSSSAWKQPETFMASYQTLLPHVRAVRITLVARGQLDSSGRTFVSGRPSIENHSPGDTSDTATSPASTRYPRMVQSTIVQLPNLRYVYGISQEFLK